MHHLRFRPTALPRRLALLAASALLFPASTLAPAQPSAFVLDGLRDPGYVLVAQDPGGDLATAIAVQERYYWADLTNLYLATDAANLYVYADLPNYSNTASSGQIGLAILVPEGANLGTAIDPWRHNHIAYEFTGSSEHQCLGNTLAQTRQPDFLIRGHLRTAGGPPDINNGNTILATRDQSIWVGVENNNWGGLEFGQIGEHVAYALASGVELSIPWVDLGLTGPTDLDVSFFSTGGPVSTQATTIGIFDSIPHDPQAPPPLTTTVLSQLQSIHFPLPNPNSIALGCDTYSVSESIGVTQVTARLNGVLTQTVAVSYTTAPLTAGLTDYTPITGTLTFAPGQITHTINLPITHDTQTEPDETLRLLLSNPLTLTLRAPYSTTITILDDDITSQLKVFVPFLKR